jgi:ADP-heptose:LPS heptosyltransferase
MMAGSPSRYLIDSTVGRAYVSALDAVLRVVAREPEQSEERPIEKVLLGIGGHIGDAVIASSALRWLREAMPDVSVGISISSAARPVLEGHERVKWIHTVDHWKLNRSAASWGTKRRRSAESNRQAREEIGRVGYDAAVDLYPYYPNMSVLMWRSGIPRRVGYVSGGGGPVFTDALEWLNSNAHMAEHQRRALGKLRPDVRAPLEYDLPLLSAQTIAIGERLLAQHGLAPKRYAVLHPGSGDARKDWPLSRWSALAELLADDGLGVVITGAGSRDEELARALVNASPRARNLCGTTELPVLRFVLRQSAGAVAIDSASAHLAAAEGTPGVVIMSPMTNVEQWRPLSSRMTVLMESVGARDVRESFNRERSQAA